MPIASVLLEGAQLFARYTQAEGGAREAARLAFNGWASRRSKSQLQADVLRQLAGELAERAGALAFQVPA